MVYITVIIIFLIIFFIIKISRTPKTSEQIQTRSELTGNELVEDDVVDGWIFCATLDTQTSLSVLAHHNEVFKGLKKDLPKYGSSRDGFWGAYLENFTDPPSQKELDTISFLTKFHIIYDSDISVDEKLLKLKGLCSNPKYSKFCDQFKLPYHEEFPESLFISKLASIPGISSKSARLLFEQGYKTKDDIKNADDKELLDIYGIGPANLKKIRNQ